MKDSSDNSISFKKTMFSVLAVATLAVMGAVKSNQDKTERALPTNTTPTTSVATFQDNTDSLSHAADSLAMPPIPLRQTQSPKP